MAMKYSQTKTAVKNTSIPVKKWTVKSYPLLYATFKGDGLPLIEIYSLFGMTVVEMQVSNLDRDTNKQYVGTVSKQSYK